MGFPGAGSRPGSWRRLVGCAFIPPGGQGGISAAAAPPGACLSGQGSFRGEKGEKLSEVGAQQGLVLRLGSLARVFASSSCGRRGGSSVTVQPPHSLQGAVSGSVQATDRLMKELRDIYRSPSFKGGKCREGGRGLLAVGTFPFVLGSTGGASEPDPFAPWCCCGENLGPWVAVAQKRAEQPLVVSVPRLCWMEARSLPWVGGLLRQKLVFDAFSSSTLPCVTGFVGHVAHTPSPNRCRQDALFRGKPVPG